MKGIIFGSVLLTAIAVGAVVAFMVMTTVQQPIIEHIVQEERHWTELAGDPPAGESGIIYCYVYPHSGNPTADYAVNLSGSWYAQGDLNTSIGTSVPYDTAFDLVIKARFNDSVYNTTGLKWELDWCRANITCSDLSLSVENLSMNEVHIVNTSEYMWVHYYISGTGGTGSGFTITHGQSVNVTYVKIEAYI